MEYLFFSIFGLGLLLSVNLVFFGSFFSFILFCYLGFISFRNFYFPFSLSLLFMEFIYTHFRLFIVANLIPHPPFIFILYITMYSYILFCLFVNIFILFNWTSFHFITFFMFTWFIRYPIYREHCTSRKLNMYWGLEWKEKPLGLRALARF